MAPDATLTIPQAGRRLGISRFRLLKLCERAGIEVLQVPGKKWPRLKLSDVQRLAGNPVVLAAAYTANDLWL